jgi:alpha-beta hydrolase superfamily lysophospholipase
MLKALGRDPLVIKQSRIDAVYGLVNLMDRAMASASSLRAPALVLYGAKDQLIPPAAVEEMTERLPASADGSRRVAYYPNGYHMLLRDLQGDTVWRDILAWMDDPRAPLPSGAEEQAAR